MRYTTPAAVRLLQQRHILAAATLAMLSACDSGAASTTVPGVASAKLADWTWTIPGTCEFSGNHMTFAAPGDPLLSIGFDSSGTPTVVGNFSSQSEGFVSFIGHPDVERPEVTIAGKTYSVSGSFFVDTDVSVHGDISIVCN